MKLAGGEFLLPGEPGDDVVTARWIFLGAVREHGPKVLQDLAELLPSPTDEELGAWASRWHLSEPWVLEVARDSIEWWAVSKPEPLTWSLIGPEKGALVPPVPSLDLGPWWPWFETRQEAERRLRKDFPKRLKAYLDGVQASLEEQGLSRPQEKRSNLAEHADIGGDAAQHFTWLALYQCQEMSHQTIADQLNRDRRSVGKALKKTADMIGLTLREPKPGRPRQA